MASVIECMEFSRYGSMYGFGRKKLSQTVVLEKNESPLTSMLKQKAIQKATCERIWKKVPGI